eukprot:scaffold775_cov274-Pinguiococcus_pyrenoidosus.AAC.13
MPAHEGRPGLVVAHRHESSTAAAEPQTPFSSRFERLKCVCYATFARADVLPDPPLFCRKLDRGEAELKVRPKSSVHKNGGGRRNSHGRGPWSFAVRVEDPKSDRLIRQGNLSKLPLARANAQLFVIARHQQAVIPVATEVREGQA